MQPMINNRGIKTLPSSLLLPSHHLLEPLTGCTRRQGGQGSQSYCQLLGTQSWGRKVRVHWEGQMEHLTEVLLNVVIVHEQKNEHSQQSHGGAVYPPTFVAIWAWPDVACLWSGVSITASFVFIKWCGKGVNGRADNSDKMCSL